ncbi:pectate lyase [Bacteroides sp. 214]|uniref:pectate lyase n=1 Tax=Bacteroides sp. 214 TaxID=2302935 RepID=UPI00351BADEB
MVLSPSGAEIPDPILAFPGAEGHGRFTVGGRGGNVYRVTTLEDNASSQPLIEGSLRWALQQAGPRTIVFDVSGTIQLKQGLGTGGDYVTIAGQTAPGNGICIAGFGFTISSNNVIIRYIRFRPGDESMGEPDGLGGMDKSNIIVDHCSVSWSVDEGLSVYGMRNSTVQWCLVSEALRVSKHEKGTHCYGGNWGGNKASYHHNIIAHCESRTPRLGPRAGTQKDEYVDIRNNVFYNWAGNGCYGGEGMNVNLVNNYYKPGPATDQASSKVQYRIAGIGIRTTSYIETFPAFAPMLHVWGKFYIDGNTMEGHPDVTADNWTKGVYEQTTNGSGVDYTWTQTTMDTIRLAKPLDAGEITTHSADKAYEQVLAYAGCSLSRDDADSRIVEDIRERKASFTSSGNKPGFINTPYDTKPANASDDWTPWLPSSTATAPIDTDKDGMPDDWEDANGLDKNNPADGNLTNSEGYTNLEIYLNSLVSNITENQNKNAITSVAKEITADELKTTAYFDRQSNTIKVNSNALINSISVYNLQGVCINTLQCNSQQAEVSTGNYSSMIVIVRVKYADGRESSAKVIIS